MHSDCKTLFDLLSACNVRFKPCRVLGPKHSTHV